MKKILFATTALVATAGVASAEVSLSGWAEIGIVGGSAYGDVTQFHTDVDVDFTLRGEADNGLTFGADVDLDEASSFGPLDDMGVSYFVAYGNARLDMGDVDGALDAALQEVNIAGTIDDLETTHAGFNANSGLDGTYDGQIATFSYAFNDFTAYMSVEMDDTDTFDPIWGLGFRYVANLGGIDLGVGVGYQQGDEDLANATGFLAAAGFGLSLVPTANPNVFDAPAAYNVDAIIDAYAADAAMAYYWPAGDIIEYVDFPDNVPFDPSESAHTQAYLGFDVNNTGAAQLTDDAVAMFAAFAGTVTASSAWGLSLDTTFSNGIMARLSYMQSEYATNGALNDATETHFGLGLGYSMNALTVGVNYGKYEDWKGFDGAERTGYALSANYDMGGGLVAQAGYGHSKTEYLGGSVDGDQFSLGLSMSF